MPKIELDAIQPEQPEKMASFYANSASNLHRGRVSADADLKSMPPAIKTYHQAESSDPLVNQQNRNNSIPVVNTSLKLQPKKVAQKPSLERKSVPKLSFAPKNTSKIAPKLVQKPVRQAIGVQSHQVAASAQNPVRMPRGSARTPQVLLQDQERRGQKSIKNIPRHSAEAHFASGSAARVAAMNAAIKQRQEEQRTARLKSASPTRSRYDSQTGMTYSEHYRPRRQEKPAPVGRKSPYFLDSVSVEKRPLHTKENILTPPVVSQVEPKIEIPTEKPASVGSEDRFINRSVEKKPLGKSKKPASENAKNTGAKKSVAKKTSSKKTGTKPERKIVRANSYDTKVIQPEKSSKIPMALLVLATIILGSVVGFILYLTLF